MAAPTKPANVKKALANSEPSTHGTELTSMGYRSMSVYGVKQTSQIHSARSANGPRADIGHAFRTFLDF
jgi:hypothetical protein